MKLAHNLQIPNYTGGYMMSRFNISISANMQNALETARLFRSDFDAAIDGAYGCFCNFAYGNKPYDQSALGNTPIDEIDASCKHLKDCLQCAKAQFGDNCTTEQTFFTRESNSCLNQAGTCERAICECHMQFGQNHADAHLNTGGHDQAALWGDMTDGSFINYRSNVCPRLCPAGKIKLTTNDATDLILEATGLFKEQRLFTDSFHDVYFDDGKWVISKNMNILAESADSPSCPDGVSQWFSESGSLLPSFSVSKPGSGSTGGEVKCCLNPTGKWSTDKNNYPIIFWALRST